MPASGQDFDESPSSRKQKSLGLLCEKFIQRYGSQENAENINLEIAAVQLSVERRRMYDIVNVLECIGMVHRTHKNTYVWRGLDAVPEAVEKLREEATMADCTDVQQSGRKKRSLNAMTQRFIQLFLTSPDGIVALDSAAYRMCSNEELDHLEDTHDQRSLKTKIRRLYDITNVLSAVKLVQKTRLWPCKKPAYQWVGPLSNCQSPEPSISGDSDHDADTAVTVTARRSVKRHVTAQAPGNLHDLSPRRSARVASRSQGRRARDSRDSTDLGGPDAYRPHKQSCRSWQSHTLSISDQEDMQDAVLVPMSRHHPQPEMGMGPHDAYQPYRHDYFGFSQDNMQSRPRTYKRWPMESYTQAPAGPPAGATSPALLAPAGFLQHSAVNFLLNSKSRDVHASSSTPSHPFLNSDSDSPGRNGEDQSEATALEALAQEADVHGNLTDCLDIRDARPALARRHHPAQHPGPCHGPAEVFGGQPWCPAGPSLLPSKVGPPGPDTLYSSMSQGLLLGSPAPSLAAELSSPAVLRSHLGTLIA